MKIKISSKNAPKEAPYFSHAILSSSKYKLELSGQIGLDPTSGKLVGDSVAEQTTQAFENIKAILAELGWSLVNITKCRVYLVDMKDYTEMNEVYAKQFTEAAPARAAMAVKELPLGAKVEIECVAEGDEVSEKNTIS